jgi:hypothetical protein
MPHYHLPCTGRELDERRLAPLENGKPYRLSIDGTEFTLSYRGAWTIAHGDTRYLCLVPAQAGESLDHCEPLDERRSMIVRELRPSFQDVG